MYLAISLSCQELVDSERMLSLLAEGWSGVHHADEADAIVIQHAAFLSVKTESMKEVI